MYTIEIFTYEVFLRLNQNKMFKIHFLEIHNDHCFMILPQSHILINDLIDLIF